MQFLWRMFEDFEEHMHAGMTFKLEFRILMMTVWQLWGSTWEWDPKYTEHRITLWCLTHRTGTILLRGGKVSLKEWLLNKCWKYQDLTTIAGAWIPCIPEYEEASTQNQNLIWTTGNWWTQYPFNRYTSI